MGKHARVSGFALMLAAVPAAALAQADRGLQAFETVRSVLAAAFGSAPIDAIALVTGGASGASAHRLEIGGRRYLLRIEGTPSPLRNPHQYLSMRIAAAAGIAPRIHYVDETSRVAVMDFIEQRPLRAYPGGPRALASRCAHYA